MIRQMPNDLNLEEIVLGGMLIDNRGVSEFVEVVKDTNVFYNQKNALIYNAILSLYKDSQPVDLVTVRIALQKKGKLKEAGGGAYLVALTEKVSSSAHIYKHALILMQLYVKRKSIEVGYHLTEQAYDEDMDIFELLDSSYKELDKVSDWLSIKQPKEIGDYLTEVLKTRAERQVVPMAIRDLNLKFNGYQMSDLTVIAGRPAMGKTAYALNDALHQARLGYPVGIFSLEMSAQQLTSRLFANFAQIDSSKLFSGTLTPSEMEVAVEHREAFNKLPLYIDEEPFLSLLSLKIKAKKWVRDKKVKIIYIDYLQLISNPLKGRTRDQEISEISRTLKGLAKELDIPIVALSQLSRSVDSRTDRRPQLSDLRESGAIEQDADNVLFLYRPEYYKIPQWEDNTPTDNEVEINIAKFRNGSVGRVIAGCQLHYMRFFERYGNVSINTYQENSFPKIDPKNNNPF
ncbi:replicative DNA helicase [Capnocytophaga sp. oral taxon 338]|uniref:replicative DNA helicase n=1 Tax=Capnocytophaga sp. oral taxon 338 TaxID=710239 RepID=UPI000202D1B4|nr:replicative DNA helicase [Capnocytophaga sp. oral taxon 338]EGD33319.1 replicative DNA helicase DnaB [Capnocytophaga sp. oral taxon 338 str. F0234]